MREIKFKYYWQFDEKIYTATQYLDYAGDWEVESDYRDFDTFKNTHVKFIGVVQYTGLKDKHGKEIYEGDIVGLQSYSWNEKTNKHDILDKVYNEGVVHIGEFESSTHDMGGGRKSIMTGWLMGDQPLSKHVIILGNMYENPELLGERNV